MVPAPDLFLDFGPGRPNWCREAWVAKEVWPGCTVIGAEACEERYNRLKKTFPGELHHMAVDAQEGSTEGFVGGRHGMFMFQHEKEQEAKHNNHKKVTVRTTTVDSLYTGGTVFIWADIEGAELRMLQGATETLASGNVLGLNLELNPRNSFRGPERCSADEVIDFLAPYGLECRGSHSHPGLVTGDFESENWFNDFLFVRRQDASR